MGFFEKTLSLIALAVGITCSLGVIGTWGNAIKEVTTSSDKTALSCTVIALSILTGTFVFILITLCCSCDKCLNVIVLIAGGAALFFAVIAYIAYYDWSTTPSLVLSTPNKVPRASEWMFGNIISSVAVLLTGCTLTFT
ncbi:hypothetical protein X801_09517 [Opisthorchis viverrini]|uniref:Uncharacterized protein n=2 Tax=Opisthorchis viverrini TaxID=6198 RepID=A0A075A4P4_OPIVI|nr:hypothetical protein T265_03031 [Opisthorchis viverrini]KER30550.1 hypothetical protein T265_03031 [Opisthorchis viverrini]OON14690.1 hypothetical protein X801_09517 [Opisthorchis viverrini]